MRKWLCKVSEPPSSMQPHIFLKVWPRAAWGQGWQATGTMGSWTAETPPFGLKIPKLRAGGGKSAAEGSARLCEPPSWLPLPARLSDKSRTRAAPRPFRRPAAAARSRDPPAWPWRERRRRRARPRARPRPVAAASGARPPPAAAAARSSAPSPAATPPSARAGGWTRISAGTRARWGAACRGWAPPDGSPGVVVGVSRCRPCPRCHPRWCLAEAVRLRAWRLREGLHQGVPPGSAPPHAQRGKALWVRTGGVFWGDFGVFEARGSWGSRGGVREWADLCLEGRGNEGKAINPYDLAINIWLRFRNSYIFN